MSTEPSAAKETIAALRDMQRVAWETGYETGRIDGAATERAIIAALARQLYSEHTAVEAFRQLLAAIDPQPDTANKEPTS